MSVLFGLKAQAFWRYAFSSFSKTVVRKNLDTSLKNTDDNGKSSIALVERQFPKLFTKCKVIKFWKHVICTFPNGVEFGKKMAVKNWVI